jgi:hypothetical protein
VLYFVIIEHAVALAIVGAYVAVHHSRTGKRTETYTDDSRPPAGPPSPSPADSP